MGEYKDVLEMCEDMSGPDFTLEVARKIIESLRAELAEKDKEIERLLDFNNDSNKEYICVINKREAEIKSLKAELAAKDKEIADLKSQCKNIQETGGKWMIKYEKAEAEIESLKAELAEKDKELHDLKLKKIPGLHIALGCWVKKHDALESKLAEKDKEIERLGEVLGDATSSYGEWYETEDRLKAEIKSLKAERNKLGNELAESFDDNTRLCDSIFDLNAENERLKKQIESHIRVETVLHGEVETAEKAIREMEGALEEYARHKRSCPMNAPHKNGGVLAFCTCGLNKALASCKKYKGE